ncbi:MAG TPA: SycD/LcrH family type III secretion system chaperone [Steroidobacteraceae bacterium]|jgi:type III secretion system low calcium response chaperone LcrH/SycD|nr:SycD/LcrH family type III secretion system chaperone [Steroidobacteraceae bacterium]
MTETTRDIGDLVQEVADFMFAGGTVADMYGLEPEELEPMYALGFSLYNQARWSEALRVFSHLTFHSHLEQRFHVGRAACLQMLKQHEDALRAFGLAYLLDAEDPSVSLHIAECLIALGKKEDARGVLENVAELTQGKAEFEQIGKRGAALVALLGH